MVTQCCGGLYCKAVWTLAPWFVKQERLLIGGILLIQPHLFIYRCCRDTVISISDRPGG